jgi:hypothetical protein
MFSRQLAISTMTLTSGPERTAVPWRTVAYLQARAVTLRQSARTSVEASDALVKPPDRAERHSNSLRPRRHGGGRLHEYALPRGTANSLSRRSRCGQIAESVREVSRWVFGGRANHTVKLTPASSSQQRVPPSPRPGTAWHPSTWAAAARSRSSRSSRRCSPARASWSLVSRTRHPRARRERRTAPAGVRARRLRRGPPFAAPRRRLERRSGYVPERDLQAAACAVRPSVDLLHDDAQRADLGRFVCGAGSEREINPVRSADS